MRKSCCAVVWGVVFVTGGVSAAEPVPVVALGDVSDARMSAVAGAYGHDALTGADLFRALGSTVGDPVPVGDPLAGPRADLDAATRAYLTAGGSREVRHRLVTALAAMEALRPALEDRAANRAAYVGGLATLSRIALDTRQTLEADDALGRSAAFDPSWTPDPRQFPPGVVQRHAAALASLARAPHGSVSVRLSRPGCTVWLDGRAVSDTPTVTVQALPGGHRVGASCGGTPRRTHPVAVTAGDPVMVSLDPDLDAVLDTSHGVFLRRDTGAGEAAVIREAVALGVAVGARRVVTVTQDTIGVLDVARGTMEATVPDAPALARWLNGTAMAVPGASEPHGATGTVLGGHTDTARRRASVGAGPWVLVGAGGAVLVAAGVLYGLRVMALGSAGQTCTLQDAGLVCPAGTDPMVVQAARGDRDLAMTYTLASGVALGVGAATVVAGALWLALGGRGRSPVAVGITPVGAGIGTGLGGQF